MVVPKPWIKFTVKEYMSLPEGAPYQLLDGEMILAPSPTTRHQSILRRLSRAIEDFVAENALGEVWFAPLDVVLSNHDVAQPDILFVSNSRSNIVTEANIQGAPDLVVEIAGPVIEFPNGQWVIAGTLSEGHTFSLGGTISNQGTVTATDIQLVVTDGGGTWQFQWPELAPGNSTEWLTPWELSNLAAGNYTVSAIATTNTESDEDPASNMDSYMLQIVPPGSHSYQITSNHVNITQFEDGHFSPTTVNITLDGDTGQGVAFVELLLDYPVAWSLQDTSGYFTGADGNVFRYDVFSYGIHSEKSQYTALLVPAGTASLLASFLPSLSSVAGPHEVGISLIDHNNLSAGSSTLTVNVPQYHGLRLSTAEQDNGDWVLFVENSGNGQETVMLTKNLPEGLTLHLSESYMQLAPFETREVRLSGIAGAKGSYSVSFSAQSVNQPELQVNLTFELSVASEASFFSWIPALLLGLTGAGVVAWAVARRRLH